MLAEALSSIVILLILCFSVVQLVRLQAERRHYPPGPAPLPFVGCFWRLKFLYFNRELLTEVSKSYGNIFTLWFGPYPVIVLNGFQAVKDGLANHPEDVTGRPRPAFFKAMANNTGILMSTGRTWKHQRRFSMLTLKTLGLGKSILEHRIREEAQYLMELFRKSKGKPVNPSFPLTLAVSNVISGIVFGRRFSAEDKTFHHLLEAMEDIFRVAGTVTTTLYDLFPGIMNWVPGPHHQALSSRDFLWAFIRQEIHKHRNAVAQDKKQDFIHFYLEEIEKMKSQPNPPFDEQNMIQSTFDLFLGGTEATSTTLTWAVLYMVLHPDIQAKVQTEMDAVLHPGQTICYEDRKKLPYTNAVIHEIQRFGNVIAIGVPRYCVRDTTIQQFHLKKGSVLFPNVASALYDPNEWETPLQFNPSHFLDKDGNFTCREAFIPFSLGHRACLGENLAKTELFLFFSHLLQAFKFTLAEGTKDLKMEPVGGATLQPQPFEISVVPR